MRRKHWQGIDGIRRAVLRFCPAYPLALVEDQWRYGHRDTQHIVRCLESLGDRGPHLLVVAQRLWNARLQRENRKKFARLALALARGLGRPPREDELDLLALGERAFHDGAEGALRAVFPDGAIPEAAPVFALTGARVPAGQKFFLSAVVSRS